MSLRSNRIPYTQNMKNVGVKAINAKTTETDTTNAYLLYTAPANAPAILTALSCVPNVTVTATRCSLYIAYAGSSTVLHRIKSVLMGATTVDTTHADTPVDFGFSDSNKLKLSQGDALYVGIGVVTSGSAGIEFNGMVEEYELAA